MNKIKEIYYTYKLNKEVRKIKKEKKKQFLEKQEYYKRFF